IRMQRAAAATMPTTMPVVLLDSRITSTAPGGPRSPGPVGTRERREKRGRQRGGCRRPAQREKASHTQIGIGFGGDAGRARPPAGRSHFKRAAARMPWAPHAGLC
uniref:Uncharacterized protein n=1 Tax=Loxodonta africana TaxID=9785 RepID=G3U9L5_LOXAF